MRPMRVQLWSIYYAPEPTGIAPVSTVLAKTLKDLGHDVDVVAAFPHYPQPIWPHPRRPYREQIDGIRVTRLPLWVGRSSPAQRLRQELSFAAAQFAALPVLGHPDVMVAASPSFPALLPAIANARLRRIPWVLWLHDILPDGAAATGLVEEGPVLRWARRLERLAYQEANRIAVLSRAFVRNLEAKGVPREKIDLIYDPATRVPDSSRHSVLRPPARRLLSMGNIGLSQSLDEVVRAFEAEPTVNGDVDFVITGSGVGAQDVARQIRTERVDMKGLVSSDELEVELQQATIGLVSQKHGGGEFNIPSKIMNFMMYGLPVLAFVDPQSEVAHIVERSGGGWVIDNADADVFPDTLAKLFERSDDIAARGEAAKEYALKHFTVGAFAERFTDVLAAVSV